MCYRLEYALEKHCFVFRHENSHNLGTLNKKNHIRALGVQLIAVSYTIYSVHTSYRVPRSMHLTWMVKYHPLPSTGHAGERFDWAYGGNKMG